MLRRTPLSMQEAEEKVMARVTEKTPTITVPEGSSQCLPGCIKEGVNYTLECLKYRADNERRQYH